MSEITLATIITSVGTVLTGVIGWFGDVLDFIVGNPLAMFGILAPLATVLIYKGFGLVRKMLNKRKI